MPFDVLVTLWYSFEIGNIYASHLLPFPTGMRICINIYMCVCVCVCVYYATLFVPYNFFRQTVIFVNGSVIKLVIWK